MASDSNDTKGFVYPYEIDFVYSAMDLPKVKDRIAHDAQYKRAYAGRQRLRAKQDRRDRRHNILSNMTVPDLKKLLDGVCEVPFRSKNKPQLVNLAVKLHRKIKVKGDSDDESDLSDLDDPPAATGKVHSSKSRRKGKEIDNQTNTAGRESFIIV